MCPNRLCGKKLLCYASLAVVVTAGLACQREYPLAMDGSARFDTWLLGRAQDGGVPHLGCVRECCRVARREGRVEYPCSLGVRDRLTGALLLIEATPAVESQVAMLHTLAEVDPRDRVPVDGVLLTHAHIGHYAGLMQFGKEVAATDELPIFCTPKMADFIRAHAPWSGLVTGGHVDLQEIVMGTDGAAVFEPVEGLRVEAIQVPHRDEYSDTVAFRLHGPAKTLLWVPDIDQWSRNEGMIERLLDGVDVAYVDGTFYDEQEVGRCADEIPHPFMRDTLTTLGDLAKAHPGRIQFIHLNHTNPALSDLKLVAEIGERGFDVPEQGRWVGL